jgi:peptidyl-prolyl cis-trans isomerase C
MSVRVNDIAVDAGPWPSPQVAAVRELLRQRAVALGLLSPETVEGHKVDGAVERLLADEVQVPSPTEAECRRHYQMHQRDFRSGDLVNARHILFQVTSGIRVPEIRTRAEKTLAELLAEPERFAVLARELSNCPSGQYGGNLGQIARGDTVPEFEQALFRLAPTGILRELVRTRYGFHIVAVDRRIHGETLPYEAVRDRIAERLTAAVEERALRQYVRLLAAQADVAGFDLDAAPTPLIQ